MKKLLSLPPNLVECFHDIERADRNEWFCTSDPIGRKLGSGGGTTWLLQACMAHEGATNALEWLAREKRILLHAGGQSRRLPGYAPSGKILTPIPVYRWGRGQRLTQNLLSLQLPLYQQMMEKAPESLHTMIVSGDILVRAGKPLQPIPEADVVCYGLWVDPSLAKNHGVFVMNRQTPEKLAYMLQKPSVETLGELMQHSYFLMDIGVWLLSDRAVELIMKRSTQNGETVFYDMYSEFGPALGAHPQRTDEEVNRLSVAILPLPEGEFYHYGTSREMISSTLAVQNRVMDQREITLHKVKPHPAMFTQNADIKIELKPGNSELWVENSFIGNGWKLSHRSIITGVPVNDWKLEVPAGVCIDVVPLGETDYVARPYGFNDAFKGSLTDDTVSYLGRPVTEWLAERNLQATDIEGANDLQAARIFPVCHTVEELGKVLQWMVNDATDAEGRAIWQWARKLSADEISAYANLRRLTAQRESFRDGNWKALAANWQRSVFYQLNLQEAAEQFADRNLTLPEELPQNAPLLTQVSDAMFRARTLELSGKADEAKEQEARAFGQMREGLLEQAYHRQSPKLSVYSDQIVWGRSPVRIDLAGGWTDTPPYCLNEGGNVINLAITLNGQPPFQVYIKPNKEQYRIILRSIDLGAMETVTTYEELRHFNVVGSPFSIPKAALALAGFHPDFCRERYASLHTGRFGTGHQLHPGGYHAGGYQRLLRTGLGQAGNRQPHLGAGTVAHHRWRLAGPVWRYPAGHQAAADRERLETDTAGTLAAGTPVHGQRIPQVPPAVLHGADPYGQGYPGGNREGNVHEQHGAPDPAATDEAACPGHARRHPAQPLRGDGPTGGCKLETEPGTGQRNESSCRASHHRPHSGPVLRLQVAGSRRRRIPVHGGQG